MYVYRGKLDYYNYAKDESITIVLPTAWDIGEQISGYWQWTVDAQGNPKANTNQQGTIDILEQDGDERKIGFAFGYYRFDGKLSKIKDTITVTMTSEKGATSSPTTLKLAYRVPV